MIQCKNPNFVVIVPDPTDSEKKKVLFYSGAKAKRDVSFDDWKKMTDGVIQVPCGNCLPCRLEYSRVWANRCYLESLQHKHTWFITLSYRDEDLVFGSQGFPTLEKDGLSGFMKRLRKVLGPGIRFFGCGEYGDAQGERAGFNPHHHLILFGPDLPDLTIDMPDMTKPMIKGCYPTFRRKNQYGEYVMFSQIIYNAWKKGKIEVEDSTWNTQAYVSRYILKKQKGQNAHIYDDLGIVPEYLRMSNRPGIGADWLIYNKNKLLNYDYLSVKNRSGVQTTRPPRYFTKLMMKDPDSVDAALMESNKLSRIINSKKRCDERLSTKDVGTVLREDADAIETKIKVLKRSFT